MKVLILAGGRGKRLGAATDGVNKCMLDVKGRPLIDYSLSCAAGARQVDGIVVVVGYRSDDIQGRFGGAYKGKPVAYVMQEERRGLVHAIECAQQAIGASDFMLMLGDELMVNPRHDAFLEEFERGKDLALCGVVRVADRRLISRTYSILQLADGRISRLIEKPNNPVNDIMGTGNCIFRNRIFEYIPYTPVNQKRGEKELPDLIQAAIDDGNTVRPFFICEDYINVNSPEELDKTRSCFAHF